MGLKAVRTVGAKAHGVSSDPRSLPLSADVPASMILIAADHAMFRDTLRNLLEQEPGLIVFALDNAPPAAMLAGFWGLL